MQRTRLAKLITKARLVRPQYYKNSQVILFTILLIPVVINFLVLISSILPYKIRSQLEYYEPAGLYILVIAYFVISGLSGRMWLTPEKENIYLLINRIFILVGLVVADFYIYWVKTNFVEAGTLLVIIELIVFLRASTPILVDYLPLKLKVRWLYFAPLLLILIFSKYLLGARPGTPWDNEALRVDIFKYALIFLFSLSIAINMYELKLLREKKVDVLYIDEVKSKHELFPRIQGWWDRVIPNQLKISYIAIIIGVITLLYELIVYKPLSINASMDIVIIFVFALFINYAEGNKFSKKYTESNLLQNHTLLVAFSYLVVWIATDTYSSTTTLGYLVPVISISQQEINYFLFWFLLSSIFTSILLPFALINNPNIKIMDYADKKSTLKFLNRYLILFSLFMIVFVSFLTRLKYFRRDIVDTVGLTIGDIFVGGVLLIQFIMQFIYTRKQLSN